VEREREKGRGKVHSPLHPCTMTPKWNSLCWLVESEGEEKERRKVVLFERMRAFRIHEASFLYLQSLNTEYSNLKLSEAATMRRGPGSSEEVWQR
jgi:hypothetical protein